MPPTNFYSPDNQLDQILYCKKAETHIFGTKAEIKIMLTQNSLNIFLPIEVILNERGPQLSEGKTGKLKHRSNFLISK